MMETKNFKRRMCGALCVLALSACASAPPVLPPPPTMEQLMLKGSEAAGAGQREQALTLWQEAAKAYPADKSPWLQMAQTRYDTGQYGEAIVSAQEVLVRDPADKVANSIIAISGLRLATRALADLSRQNNLSGSTRTESQDLAKLLRESLGETVLVPPARESRPASRTAFKRKGAREESNSADPFGALK
jgi:tetratricopeptide (TPR) repeat protein